MRVLVIGGYSRSLVNFRGALLSSLVSVRHEVHAAAPHLLADHETRQALELIEVTPHDIRLQRTGLNPIADILAFWSMLKLMRTLQPDAILTYTVKPVIWGTLAAAAARVPKRFALITGLGYAFTDDVAGNRSIVKRVAQTLYGLALSRASKVFFQNRDDAALFKKLDLVPQAIPVAVLRGSGVDLVRFKPAPLPKYPITFLLIARLIGDKGIREYVNAADLVRKKHPETTFHLVGPLETSPAAIKREEIERWQAEGRLIWFGEAADVRSYIAQCHVYVLPSYREGTPRSVLEAMAMQRAIITTDVPGCRETVESGVNGFLIPPRDGEALAAAMLSFLEAPHLAEQMGEQSRRIAEEVYDVHKVNATMLQEMKLT